MRWGKQKGQRFDKLSANGTMDSWLQLDDVG
jgi:hypothetical protein